MNWNLEGLRVKGRYMDSVNVSGVVKLSRVAYGGEVQHYVTVDRGFSLFKGAVKRGAGETVILEHHFIAQVYSSLNEFIR
jgi:hypothetical protein